jgi:hypothetical protein
MNHITRANIRKAYENYFPETVEATRGALIALQHAPESAVAEVATNALALLKTAAPGRTRFCFYVENIETSLAMDKLFDLTKSLQVRKAERSTGDDARVGRLIAAIEANPSATYDDLCATARVSKAAVKKISTASGWRKGKGYVAQWERIPPTQVAA